MEFLSPCLVINNWSCKTIPTLFIAFHSPRHDDDDEDDARLGCSTLEMKALLACFAEFQRVLVEE